MGVWADRTALDVQDPTWPTLIELLSSTPVDDRGLAEVLTSPNKIILREGARRTVND